MGCLYGPHEQLVVIGCSRTLEIINFSIGGSPGVNNFPQFLPIYDPSERIIYFNFEGSLDGDRRQQKGSDGERAKAKSGGETINV